MYYVCIYLKVIFEKNTIIFATKWTVFMLNHCLCRELGMTMTMTLLILNHCLCIQLGTYSSTLVLYTLGVFILSTPEKGGRSSTNSSQCRLRGLPYTPRLASLASWYLATSLLTLGLKLHMLHLAAKFFSALQARFRTTCLQSAPCAVSTQTHS